MTKSIIPLQSLALVSIPPRLPYRYAAPTPPSLSRSLLRLPLPPPLSGPPLPSHRIKVVAEPVSDFENVDDPAGAEEVLAAEMGLTDYWRGRG